jgi:hypothetical protein
MASVAASLKLGTTLCFGYTTSMALSPSYLTPDQRTVIETALDGRVFLSGPAGTGKSTVGVERVLHLLENGVPGNQILLLVPQRTLATPYYDALHSPNTPSGGAVSILTVGGLARRMVDLFWPIVSEAAGFAHPNQVPTFLTLETAQYYMAHLVRPLLAEGYFDSLSLDRNRLYSQIVDNLNKAAVHGFAHTDIGERLKSAWVGDPGQTRIYEDVQHCANLFREFCLTHNLLDFSLQLEIFLHQLWSAPLCRDYLTKEYRHLIFDNLEEDTPVSADLLQEWLPEFDSVLLIYDSNAGYRRFLGADPDSTMDLTELTDVHTQFTEGFVSTENIATFGLSLANAISPEDNSQFEIPNSKFAINYPIPAIRFYPDMLDWVADQIAALVDAGTPLSEIVILAPYLSDALRYALVDRLERLEIPSRSHRPSRSLREEPATRCLLTLAKLAHPQWGLVSPKADVAYALMQAIADLDLVRAQLLTEIIYRKGQLVTFDAIKPEVQERITYVLGGRFENLRIWLEDYVASGPQELDHFLSRLFGEVLSQPGYGFHVDYNAGSIAANLVESVQKFRWVAGEVLAAEDVPLGKEYLQMVEDGVIAAQYLQPWQSDPEDAVFLAPAYTFLMANRPVDYQFWLDVGGRGWYERLYQPLTHPHVLSRHWPIGQPWTDINEMEHGQDALLRLSLGLIRRCREGIFLGLSELGEQGYEHKGELLRAIDKALRTANGGTE